MTDREQINDVILDRWVDMVVDGILDDMAGGGGDGCFDLDRACEMAFEAADGAGHVIYTAQAHELCRRCDTSRGEAWLSDVGWGGEGGDAAALYDRLATRLAFAESLCRVEARLFEVWRERGGAANGQVVVGRLGG